MHCLYNNGYIVYKNEHALIKSSIALCLLHTFPRQISTLSQPNLIKLLKYNYLQIFTEPNNYYINMIQHDSYIWWIVIPSRTNYNHKISHKAVDGRVVYLTNAHGAWLAWNAMASIASTLSDRICNFGRKNSCFSNYRQG